MRKQRRIAAYAVAFAAMLDVAPAQAAQEAQNTTQAPTAQRDVWTDITFEIIPEGWGEITGQRMLGTLVEQLGKDPDMADFEREYPGVLDAFREALAPLMHSEVTKLTPLYRADLDALYRTNLDAIEAEQVLAFLRSSAFRNFRDKMISASDFHTTVRDAVKGRDISQEALAADTRTAALQASLQTDSADMKTMEAFLASPAGMKFKALNPEKFKIDHKWSNYLSPEAQAQIEPLVFQAMIDHVAKTDPEVAQAMADELFKNPKGKITN